MATWNFLTNHGRVLLCIAHDPQVRLRDIAATLGITERSAYGIVSDLTEAGYVIKDKDGRRNRYQVQEHLPLPDALGREQAIGEVLELLTGRNLKGGNNLRRRERGRRT
jgi:DNA-binding transcriptional ArsR family regulator